MDNCEKTLEALKNHKSDETLKSSVFHASDSGERDIDPQNFSIQVKEALKDCEERQRELKSLADNLSLIEKELQAQSTPHT